MSGEPTPNRRGRTYFLGLSVGLVLVMGLLGAVVGATAQIEVVETVALFGLVELEATPVVLGAAGMVTAAAAMLVLFGLVSVVSRYADEA